jgi:hypothetical protein
MRPCLAPNYLRDVLNVNTKLGSQFRIGCPTSGIARADFANLFFGESGIPLSLAFYVIACVANVLIVLFSRTPGEVAWTVVGPDGIQMAAFHSFGLGTVKSDQDDSVKPERSLLSLLVHQSNCVVAPSSMEKRSKFAPMRIVCSPETMISALDYRPNTPIVANSIAWETGNVAVLNNVARMMLNHDLYSSYGLWPEPADVCASVRLASFYHQTNARKSWKA